MTTPPTQATHRVPSRQADAACRGPGHMPRASTLPPRTRDTLSKLRNEMHTMLTLAQYVASSVSVLEAINFRARCSPDFEATMGDVHPTWRDPDYHGETLGALAQLIGMAWESVHKACATIDQQNEAPPRDSLA